MDECEEGSPTFENKLVVRVLMKSSREETQRLRCKTSDYHRRETEHMVLESCHHTIIGGRKERPPSGSCVLVSTQENNRYKYILVWTVMPLLHESRRKHFADTLRPPGGSLLQEYESGLMCKAYCFTFVCIVRYMPHPQPNLKNGQMVLHHYGCLL